MLWWLPQLRRVAENGPVEVATHIGDSSISKVVVLPIPTPDPYFRTHTRTDARVANARRKFNSSVHRGFSGLGGAITT